MKFNRVFSKICILAICLVFVSCSSKKLSIEVKNDESGKVKTVNVNGKKDDISKYIHEKFDNSLNEKYNVKVQEINTFSSELKNVNIFEIGGNKIISANFEYNIFGEKEETVSFYIYDLKDESIKKLEINLDGEKVNDLNSLSSTYENEILNLEYYNPYTYTKDGNNSKKVNFKYNLKFDDGKIVLNSIKENFNKEHDLDKAFEFTDLISVGAFNFEHERPYGFDPNENKFLTFINSVTADSIYDKNYKLIDRNNYEMDLTYEISLYSVLDFFNKYNSKIYNLDEVYNGIKNQIKSSEMFEYIEIDDSFNLYDKKELEKLLFYDYKSQTPQKFKLIYFLKDKKFIFKDYAGMGGIPPKPLEKEKWIIEGDTIKIPFYEMDSNKVSKTYVLLKLNNKDYTYNKRKSKYFVEKYGM